MQAKEPPEPTPARVPEPLRLVVDRALRVDPADRFPTAEAMGAALADAMRKPALSATHADVAALMEANLGDVRSCRAAEIVDQARASRPRVRLIGPRDPFRPMESNPLETVREQHAGRPASTPGPESERTDVEIAVPWLADAEEAPHRRRRRRVPECGDARRIRARSDYACGENRHRRPPRGPRRARAGASQSLEFLAVAESVTAVGTSDAVGSAVAMEPSGIASAWQGDPRARATSIQDRPRRGRARSYPPSPPRCLLAPSVHPWRTLASPAMAMVGKKVIDPSHTGGFSIAGLGELARRDGRGVAVYAAGSTKAILNATILHVEELAKAKGFAVTWPKSQQCAKRWDGIARPLATKR